MKIIVFILFFLFSYSSSHANEKICGWIMDEPFKEYQDEAKDKHSSINLKSKEQLKILDQIN